MSYAPEHYAQFGSTDNETISQLPHRCEVGELNILSNQTGNRFDFQIPLRMLQTAANSGGVPELTFPLYKENGISHTANWQINSWNW